MKKSGSKDAPIDLDAWARGAAKSRSTKQPDLAKVGPTTVTAQVPVTAVSLPVSHDSPNFSQKQKIGDMDVSSLPRISMSLSLATLRAECKARGVKGISQQKKVDIVEALGFNSVLLCQTEIYQNFEKLRTLMKEEADRARKDPIAQNAKRKRKEEWDAEQERVANRRIERERKKFEEKEAGRREGLETKVVPSVHSCPLYQSQDLVDSASGVRRAQRGNCDKKLICCTTKPVLLSCTLCNFDICQACLEYGQMSSSQQAEQRMKIASKKEAARRAEDQRKLALEHARAEKEKERQKLFISNESLPVHLQQPSKRHRDPTNLFNFVVWTSFGYGNDGWHSYNAPPKKEFDSSFDTKEDANRRARFLFWVENPWGLSQEEMDRFECTVTERSGLKMYVTEPPDSQEYAVAVVPKETYLLELNNTEPEDYW